MSLCLSPSLVPIHAQRAFGPILPRVSWSPRASAAVYWVNKSTVFVDGVNGNVRTVNVSNYLLLFGGSSNYGAQNDVWVSRDGATWYWVSGISDNDEHPRYSELSFYPVIGGATAMDQNYRFFIAGGAAQGSLTSEVWMSISGDRWVLQTEYPEWQPCYMASLVADRNNYLYLAGGINQLGPNPRADNAEVWRSTNSGRNWWLLTSSGSSPRASSILLSLSNALLWMTGVDTNIGPFDPPEAYFGDGILTDFVTS